MIRIGVCPPRNIDKYLRLFRALEEVLPLEIVPCALDSLDGLSALIIPSGEESALQAAEAHKIPCFAVIHPTDTQITDTQVRFSTSNSLDCRLRSQTLLDSMVLKACAIPSLSGDTVFASSSGKPIWVRRSFDGCYADLCSVDLSELEPREVLRHHLQGDRFLSLLPLHYFLREQVVEVEFQPPPVKATIHIDDPNFHKPTYGYINFHDLAEHVRRYDYHLAIAMIPMDMNTAHFATVQRFRNNPCRLSVLPHGTDHSGIDLREVNRDGDLLRRLAQTLRIIADFASSHQLAIPSVMVPPHCAVSGTAVELMHQLGYEACTHAVFPYNAPLGPRKNTRIPSFAGWLPVDSFEDNFPVFRRLDLEDSITQNWHRGEIVIGAYLNQPIVLSAHHNVFESGFDKLAEAVQRVNSVGGVLWGSPLEMSRSCYLSKQVGKVLEVKPLTNHISLEVPCGIERFRISRFASSQPEEVFLLEKHMGKLVPDGYLDIVNSEENDKPTRLDISIRHEKWLSPSAIPLPKKRYAPKMRRYLTSARDRLQPAIASVTRSSRGEDFSK
jgi:hypothetical protein